MIAADETFDGTFSLQAAASPCRVLSHPLRRCR